MAHFWARIFFVYESLGALFPKKLRYYLYIKKLTILKIQTFLEFFVLKKCFSDVAVFTENETLYFFA